VLPQDAPVEATGFPPPRRASRVDLRASFARLDPASGTTRRITVTDAGALQLPFADQSNLIMI